MQIHLFLERLVERKLLESGQSEEADEPPVKESDRVLITKENVKDVFKMF